MSQPQHKSYGPPDMATTTTSTTAHPPSGGELPRPFLSGSGRRTDEILETGQTRAEALEIPSPGSVPNRTCGASLGRPRTRDRAADGPVDEMTGIMIACEPELNYHTADAPPSPSSAGAPPRQRRPTVGDIGTAAATPFSRSSGCETPARKGRSRGSSSPPPPPPPPPPQPPQPQSSRLREFLSQFGSIELENKGSVARDHLAIERTFLAWLRTSLAFASIGVGVTQLFRLNATLSASGSGSGEGGGGGGDTAANLGKPLGATFLAISIIMLLLGYQRYISVQQWVIKGKFPASRGTILLVSAAAFILIVASLVLVIVVQPPDAAG